jgi:hypothetical protein
VARQLYENSFRAALNRIRRCATSLKNFPKSARGTSLEVMVAG